MSLHRVVVLLVGPVVAYDAVIPSQVLGLASGTDGRPLYDVRLASVGGQAVSTVHGYDLGSHGDQRLIDDADLVIVPGTHHPGIRREGHLPDDLRSALARRLPAARLASICTGAFVLAAAGILDGRAATTHWNFAGDFRRLFPKVALDPRVLYVDDGDVCTSAGLSAGIDLCLHLIRSEHGAQVANHVARHLVVPPWRDGGQAQFIDIPLPEKSGQSTSDVRAWASTHLAERITLQNLAGRARMSVRTFNRRFRAETGMTPGAWLTQQRTRAAQRMLETTDLSIEEVAVRAGFGTAASLRTHLRRSAGVSPATYRGTFRTAN
ncbi:GlxA family transcriptional regulator [Amycolatopsis pigmentata]|uniref:GlxA family transcriptional regulator n=1 Tax=Amycolatopsis pigmentata TaxID=450801 RepID=A0ABW5FLL4_9PSEU